MARIYLVSITLCIRRSTITCELDNESVETSSMLSMSAALQMNENEYENEDNDEGRDISRDGMDQLSKQDTVQSRI